MMSTITPSRFMLAGQEYVKHDFHPSERCKVQCGLCDLGDSPACHDAPPCDPEHNQGQMVYFKLEQT